MDIDKKTDILFEYYKEIANLLHKHYLNNKKDNKDKFFYNGLLKDMQRINYSPTSKYNFIQMKNDINTRTALYNFFYKINRKNNNNFNLVFPFKTNKSQIEAVENAFKNNFSIIQGPPGTGKTQTILNIIANVILENKTVGIVSSNNSAIENVYNKMKKSNLDFLCILAGRSDNIKKAKEYFFDAWINKKNEYISQNNFKEIKENNLNIINDVILYYTILNDYKKRKFIEYEQKNNLEHLELLLKENPNFSNIKKITFSKKFNKILIKSEYSKFFKIINRLTKKEKLSFWTKKYIKKNFSLTCKTLTDLGNYCIINFLELSLFNMELKEYEKHTNKLKEELNKKDLKLLLEEFYKYSWNKLNNFIIKKYNSISNINKNSELINSSGNDFIKYAINYSPVFMSTFSSISNNDNLANDLSLDYLIIDEASQAHLVACLPAFARVKNVIIIGDLQQLEEINGEDINYVKKNISKEWISLENSSYSFYNNNVLSSILKLFGNNIPKVVLKEHYRCDPDIISFCNDMYYEGKLIPMKNITNEHNSLNLTVLDEVGYTQGKTSFYEAKEAVNSVNKWLNQGIKTEDIGIVVPYRNQAELIKKMIGKNINVEVDTVHSYQGREKERILYCITQNNKTKIKKFVANPHSINVAVSRAIKEFKIILPSSIYGAEYNDETDINKLVNYIKRKLNIDNVVFNSIGVFSGLTKFNSKKTKEEMVIKKFIGEMSEFVVFNILNKIKKDKKIDFAMHYRLNLLIQNQNGFTEKELSFINHPWSHVDFILFDKFSKKPLLAIEVDGKQHLKEKQHNRDLIKDKALEQNKIKIYRAEVSKINKTTEEFENLIKSYL